MAVQADTATADERAQLARAVEMQIEGHPEWILLSTCHRVELYGFGARPDLHASLQVEAGEEAVRHLIRVATGLESAIVGEDEVLHQVREALGQARASRAVDRRCDFLGIDDLYVRLPALPRGYIDEAGRVVASKTCEYIGWLERGT